VDIDGLKEYIMLRRLKGEGIDDEISEEEAPTRSNSLANNRPAALTQVKQRTFTQ
jgi:hypothetical protein